MTEPQVKPKSNAEILLSQDPCVTALGFRIDDHTPGALVLSLTVGRQHLNFNGVAHGGVLFTLADTAFGCSANALGQVSIGIDTHMTFNAPAREGDVVTARATEVTRSSRLATYRVDLTRQDGRPIGCFTGTVFLPGQRQDLLPDDPPVIP